MSDKNNLFDRVLKSIGDNDKYQKRFQCFFIFFVGVCSSLAYNNLFMISATPEHYCHVPGRNETNISIYVWRDTYLPKQQNTQGKLSFSHCKMYNISQVNIGLKQQDIDLTECIFGYDYNDTWFHSTVPSSQDWVCDKEMNIINVLAGSRLGKVFGTILLGQLGDYIGRRPSFLIACILTVVTKILGLFSASYYYAFLFVNCISLFPPLHVLSATMVLGTEITSGEERSKMPTLFNLSWSIGMAANSLIFWMYPYWIPSIIASATPMVLIIFTYRWLIESPKWLLSRGKVDEAIQEFDKVAKINRKVLDSDLKDELKKYSISPEKTYGVISLFSSWRLAKNSVLLNTSLTLSMVSYFVIVLNSNNLEGNPFQNFTWQALVEIPGPLLGLILCNKIGRHYTASLAFFASSVMFLIITFFVTVDGSLVIVNSLFMTGKLFLSITFYAIMLQSIEIYPTCVRQTGSAFGSAMSGGFCVFGPYIVYLGTSVDARYPHLILSIMSFISGICQLFLPETLNAKLPETLQEAKSFGNDQSFFSMPKKQSDNIEEELVFLKTSKTNK